MTDNPQVFVLANTPAEAFERQEIIERKGGIRLNGEMRSSVVDKVINHKFKKASEALDAEEGKLARAAWLKAFGPAKMKHALALGEPFIAVNKDYRYDEPAKDGIRVNWRVGERIIALRMKDLPLPACVHNFAQKFFKVTDEALKQRIRDWADEVEKQKKERQKLEATISGLLNKVTTYPSLEKTWPEGKSFYQHIPKQWPFRHQVPAVTIAELNSQLGL